MPEPISSATAMLLKGVPEFTGRYLSLAETFDCDLGDHGTFAEFADFVSEALHQDRPAVDPGPGRALGIALVAKCLDFIEDLAGLDSPDIIELVAIGFLDNLAPGDVNGMWSWFGPATLALWDELESGSISPGDDWED
ncbi:MAG: DUF7674 family protein [Acidimicrobiales bacterium]